MTDLRTPHERRSDQLSILVRRPLSATLGTRFVRTSDTHVHSPQSFRFDDYDSDTETEGPVSEVSAATTSTTSSTSDAAVADVIPQAVPFSSQLALRRRTSSGSPSGSPISASSSSSSSLPTAKVDGVHAIFGVVSRPVKSPQATSPEIQMSDFCDTSEGPRNPPPNANDFIDDLPFQRARARSFYGAAAAAADDDDNGGGLISDDESESSDGGSGSPQFVNGVFAASPISETRLRRALEDDYDLFARRSQHSEGNMSSTRKRANTAPILERRHTSGSSPELGGRGGERGFVRRLASAAHTRTTSRTRRSRSNVSVEDVRARAEELRALIPDDTFKKAAAPGRVPLFVEEAGRNPRVAFVNGDLHRVRVRRSSLDGGGVRTKRRGGCIRSRIARAVVKRMQECDAGLAVERRRKRRIVRARKEKERMAETGKTTRRERGLFHGMWTR